MSPLTANTGRIDRNAKLLTAITGFLWVATVALAIFSSHLGRAKLVAIPVGIGAILLTPVTLLARQERETLRDLAAKRMPNKLIKS